MNAELGIFVVTGVALVVTAAFGLERWLSRDPAHELARMATTPLADARDGEVVKAVGRIRLQGPTLRSPLTGRACCFHRVAARPLLAPSSVDEAGCDFLLDDGSAVALVAAEGMRVLDGADHFRTDGPWREETVLRPGERVVVRAVARVGAPAGGYRDPSGPSLRLVGTAEHPLLVVAAAT